MKISQAGINAIKVYEGVRLKAYDDGVGIQTIGAGHTKGVKRGDEITMAQVDQFLHDDLAEAEKTVNSRVLVPLTQGQYDALVSFVFNVGSGAFMGSTLLKKLTARDYDGAANELLRWNKGGGKVMAGLTKRRISERMMFLEGRA